MGLNAWERPCLPFMILVLAATTALFFFLSFYFLLRGALFLHPALISGVLQM